ncbi:helix-turn-helix domain-containing protein [Sinomonas gamaensis]|uniref:helix-turn-helix domain-containing protein n=1 Tax=Sinomonas gamaensis TaxID=2565624 RepID=UPI001108A192|nr:helix-turn-helix domain-containing protein [Sinomonas gamaensis]
MQTIDDLDPHRFYTPEEIAPYMGIAPSTLRGYCRASKLFTRVGRRMMLDPEDATAVRQWIKDQNPMREWWEEPEPDPFAP